RSSQPSAGPARRSRRRRPWTRACGGRRATRVAGPTAEAWLPSFVEGVDHLDAALEQHGVVVVLPAEPVDQALHRGGFGDDVAVVFEVDGVDEAREGVEAFGAQAEAAHQCLERALVS